MSLLEQFITAINSFNHEFSRIITNIHFRRCN